MPTIDLTPFGFTTTESLVYAALLRLGPSTGYGVARATRLARANAYGALEGLVSGGAAFRSPPPSRPVHYRPSDPQTLLAQLAARQGAALDRLGQALRDASLPLEPETRVITGERAVGNLIHQLVARAERRVAGMLAAALWRPTLPAWRRAAARAVLDVKLAGDSDAAGRVGGAGAADTEGILTGAVSGAEPTILLIDDAQVIMATAAGDATLALWSAHPHVVELARRALRTPPPPP
jgi:sugar-specific transcriptional regulator TrmB